MNHHSAYDRAYDRAHDEAQRLARRHELDLHWAKERRRRQEREIAAAAALLASSPWALARRSIAVSAILLVVVGAGAGFAAAAGLPNGWRLLADAVAVALAVTVLSCAAASLLGLRARRVAARVVLQARDARLSHTQYRIHESVHSYIDSRVDAARLAPLRGAERLSVVS